MPAEIAVRDAATEDIDTIVSFNAAMAREAESITLDLHTLRKGTWAVLEDPEKGRYFLAEIDGTIVGQCMITYEWSDWRNGMYVWLQSVYVDPAHRRKGVYRALYDHIRGLSQGRPYCGIRLYVHETNETARAVYTRLGMVDGKYDVLETKDPLK
jgi:GNAT superfamily N-acetyltransferase